MRWMGSCAAGFRTTSVVLTLLALGCGSDSRSHDKPGMVSMPIPLAVSATVTSLGPLTAEVVVDGTLTFSLAVDLTAGTVSGTIAGLTPGPHVFAINFYSATTAFGTVLIATINVDVDVVAGETKPLDIGSVPVTKPDTDNDGVSNLDELGYGLNPSIAMAKVATPSVGPFHSCAVEINRTLWCWGANQVGQLGDGTTASIRVTPVQESTGATNWATVSVGSAHTCAIKTTGTLWCWGSNGSGQLGIGTNADRLNPTQESTGGTTWASVSAGTGYTCAVKTTGTLWCWGGNTIGQLGNGSLVDQLNPTPEATGVTDWAAVATGISHTCALKTTGTLWCWGANYVGQLGDGSMTDRRTPTQEGTRVANWALVSAGAIHTCAIKTTGTLWCWGNNGWGQVGDGTAIDRINPTQESTGSSSWVQASAGSGHTCAVKSTGTLWCWGGNDTGQRGDTATTVRQIPTQDSSGATDWASVVTRAEASHTCALKTSGVLWCWGLNNYGQLGRNVGTSQIVPRQESTSGVNWSQVSAGGAHTCAVKTTGTIWCWGWNFNGQLGDGSTGDRLSPIQEVTTATDWATVAAGPFHTCAVKATGAIWCWGSNVNGQLGDGTANDRPHPTQENSGASDWGRVSVGDNYTCAVKTTGTLWCWGGNAFGQLGDGTTLDRLLPTQEGTRASDWATVSATGQFFSCAVKTTGTLWCWGSNGNGSLGDGTTVDRPSPTQEATGAANWAMVSAGSYHTCAVKTTGTLWCWGNNGLGQLGDDTITNRLLPIREGTIATNWATVSAGASYTCAVKTSGTLWCWGHNGFGQLGDGTTVIDRLRPTQEGTAVSNWATVSAKASHTCAVRTSGTLWCWGHNFRGEIGSGAGGPALPEPVHLE